MKSGRERLREWIDRSKLNQREAANLIGIHPVVLNQYLSGARTPELNSAHLIEDVTGISTESWRLTSVSDESSPADADPDNSKLASR